MTLVLTGSANFGGRNSQGWLGMDIVILLLLIGVALVVWALVGITREILR